jgi:hypothetical protein
MCSRCDPALKLKAVGTGKAMTASSALRDLVHLYRAVMKARGIAEVLLHLEKIEVPSSDSANAQASGKSCLYALRRSQRPFSVHTGRLVNPFCTE